jgi:signal transduction histidine kinase
MTRPLNPRLEGRLGNGGMRAMPAMAMNNSSHHGRPKVHSWFLIWLGTFTLVLALAASASAADPAVVKKIVSHYALTSANDFPQRDPQDWRLLASNDNGQTWTVLDVRQGELFSERHQRRVFDGHNRTAYNLYRLEIDRVRDPGTADAVQLAQLEPMGETETDFTSTPLFCDRITAEGENAPTETARQAFDGKVETKWLDTASQHPATRSSWIQWQYLDHAGLVITNVAQLLSLGVRANEQYPVKIALVAVGLTEGATKLCLLDASGHFDVDSPGQSAAYVPGQRLSLSGTSQWRGQEVVVQQRQLQPLTTPVPAEPELIEPGQLLPGAVSLRWAETDGEVRFVTRSDNDLAFELIKNGRTIQVQVEDFKPGELPPAVGEHVGVRGLCEGVLNESGRYVAGMLRMASLERVTQLTQASPVASRRDNTNHPAVSSEAGAVLTEIDQIRHLTQAELSLSPAVKVRGVITEPFGSYLQDGTGGAELWTDGIPNSSPPTLGSYVAIDGHAIFASGHGVAGYGPVIRADHVHYLGKAELPQPIHPSWSLLASGQMDAQWVEVNAVVRATDGSHLLLACESGQLMATIRSAPAAQVTNLVDAAVCLRGVSVAATDERGQMQGVQLVVPSMEFIEVLAPPAASSALATVNMNSLLQVRGPRELVHRVKVHGVLTCYDNNNFFLQDGSGSVMAIAEQDVILNLPAGGWWSFWQNPKNTNSPGETNLQIGDQVEAMGFPEIHDDAPVLTEAILHKIGPVASVTPVKTTVASLAKGEFDSTLVTLDGLVLGSEDLGNEFVLQIQSGQKIFQAFLSLAAGREAPQIASGCRVSLTGVCQMEPAVHAELGKSPSAFSILLRQASDITVLEKPPWLTVRQVLLAAAALLAGLFGAFVWIRLLHRQVELRTLQLKQEIAEHEKTEALLDGKTRLLQREIAEHEQTEATLAEKTGLLEGEIRERQSIYDELEEKKRSLEREIEERKRAQTEIEKIHKQLLTTSRLAGMAEVATSVLHNVGNVLNGVNVLASAIVNQLRKSKVSGVSRLAGLLAEHQSDLGHFITQDPGGQHVPGHLERLGTHLTEEQARLTEKVTRLMESVQHVKEIVAMQQNYARVSGVWETAVPAEVVEDALKMCGEALARHEIQVMRDYEATPPAIMDRHKVLQILFNLIDNAKHACIEPAGTPRRIVIKIRRPEPQRLQVAVSDNGIGIPAENLRRIFSQGFSTRKNGHGFGLHGSILAAQDMGGSLAVLSDGPGAGATFVLNLPLTFKEALELAADLPNNSAN